MTQPIIIIPIHLASKRLPNKPILKANGKMLMEYTAEQAERVSDRVYYAIDKKEYKKSPEVQDSLRNCIPMMLTNKDHWCGTSRAAEALERIEHEPDDSVIVWQVDEPLVDTEWILYLSRMQKEYDVLHNCEICVWTISAKIRKKDISNSNVVKCWDGCQGGMYCCNFGREFTGGLEENQNLNHHVGVYAFSARCLKFLASFPQTKLSKEQSLEQATWLDHGFPVYDNFHTKYAPLSINTQEDWDKFEDIVCTNQ